MISGLGRNFKNGSRMSLQDSVLEFVKRIESDPEIKEKANLNHKFHIWRKNKWQRENSNRHQENLKKYERSEKGILSRKSIAARRRNKMKKALEKITEQELILINEFYDNRPPGYEVDHIIPISKGGGHTISNLQYLSPQENKKKYNKLSNEIHATNLFLEHNIYYQT